MASTTGEQNIRGLDIDKTVKGFALREYIFKKDVNVSNMSADHVRWYQETAQDLTPSGSQGNTLGVGSSFAHLEPSWTRNTSYFKKYGFQAQIDMEDEKSSDIDVMARTLLRLTRAVVKQVDTAIWNALTEDQSASNIQSFDVSTVGGDTWDASTGDQNPVKDLLHARKLIEDYDYSVDNLVAYVSPYDFESLMSYLYSKGAQATQAGNQVVSDGKMMTVAGITIKSSNNVTSDYALVTNPSAACTWKSFYNTSSAKIEEKGIGTVLRVYEAGVPILHDPKACVLLTNTQA